ncbi:EAL domain-containing protein [Pseudomonas sp. Leaf58]|uniref:EAL domain-containing response regulator n=1 Tax=Pseudomonas sp. Leaf58 TaxID=1736226 RepID=UPI0006F85E38|nr:EAL domain-containing response regulator [Pseudomonas sp. Leaf58]AYG43802.1 EAL domain-containing protein [Pseudomonas sp. Leaf58]KQN67272.1 diguanylate phosphodiesterase [Pseudomonas sp. Leaf58]
MNPISILIVEDHAFLHAYLQHLFSELGTFSTDAVQDGHQALERLHKRDYDLVLTDLMMPGMDGVQFIQYLSKISNKPALAIMSAASERLILAASLAARNHGLDVLGTFPKPIKATDLCRLVDRLKMRRKAARQAAPSPLALDRQTLICALNNFDFQPWFQPQKNLKDGTIVGAEALVRWVQPSQKVLLPGSFLPSIQSLGLEEHLLWVVLKQAIHTQACWRALGHDITVSINLPTHLLDNQDLADRLLDFVKYHQGIPSKLCFELMECSVPKNMGNFFAGACRLRMKGFGLAQDDFGKGYSSYKHLLSTPFTELKVDRALVQRCDESNTRIAALASIVALGRELGLTVVAEGVETRHELDVLRKIGCNRIQGFLISDAVPAEQLTRLLHINGTPACK